MGGWDRYLLSPETSRSNEDIFVFNPMKMEGVAIVCQTRVKPPLTVPACGDPFYSASEITSINNVIELAPSSDEHKITFAKD